MKIKHETAFRFQLSNLNCFKRGNCLQVRLKMNNSFFPIEDRVKDVSKSKKINFFYARKKEKKKKEKQIDVFN